MSDEDELYSDHILEHFESPYHKGPCEGCSCAHADRNPICGDQIRLELRLKGGTVDAAYFQGKGCAISQAAASILCEHVEGKTLAELRHLQASDMLSLLKVRLTPSRQKCGLLGFKVLKTLLYGLDTERTPTGSPASDTGPMAS